MTNLGDAVLASYAEMLRLTLSADLALLSRHPWPDPIHGPREPDPTLLFEGEDIRVERRCNGEPIVSIRTGEFYDWERVDRADAIAVAAALHPET